MNTVDNNENEGLIQAIQQRADYLLDKNEVWSERLREETLGDKLLQLSSNDKQIRECWNELEDINSTLNHNANNDNSNNNNKCVLPQISFNANDNSDNNSNDNCNKGTTTTTTTATTTATRTTSTVPRPATTATPTTTRTN